MRVAKTQGNTDCSIYNLFHKILWNNCVAWVRAVHFIISYFRKTEEVGKYHHKLLHKIFIYHGLKWMGYRWEDYVRSSYIKEGTTKGAVVNYLFYYYSGISVTRFTSNLSLVNVITPQFNYKQV